MKYIKQLLYILGFCFAGYALEQLLPLPVPAAIYGMVLMFTALCTGLLKPERIADTAQFLIGLLPILFVAPGVQILRYWDLIKPQAGAILLICVLSTWVVFAVSGLTAQLLLKKKGDKEDDSLSC